MYELTEEIKLEKNYKHTIEIVVDRLVGQAGDTLPAGGFDRDGCCAMTGGLALVDVVGRRGDAL